MSHEVFKKQIYSGLLEILKDKQMYYSSVVGHNYCHLTEEGEKAVIQYIKLMAPIILEKEQKELERLAKEMTWRELKR